MTGTLAIARHLARQAVDDRLHWSVAAYALGCVAGVPLATATTLGSGSRGAWEVGLTLAWLLTCGAGGWLGLRAVGLELQRGTAAVLLSGPLSPGRWLAGRALGAAASLLALVAAYVAVWLLVCAWRGLTPSAALLAWAAATWVEGLLVGALAALLSAVVRPVAAAGATAGLWVAGHLAGAYTAAMREYGAGALATAVYAVVPDLDRLDVHGALSAGQPIDALGLASALTYAAAWLVALGALTVAATKVRDLG